MDEQLRTGTRAHVKMLWISDVHLGSKSCQAAELLRFLDHVTCDQLYLLGDIVDVIALKRAVHWPDLHTQVARKIVDVSCSGTEVIYIPGNHDDPFRAFVGSAFDQIEIRRRCIHITADGRRLLLMHGDEMDAQLRSGAWFGLVGHLSYCALMKANRMINRLRTAFGMPYWSLAAHIKTRVGKAREYIRLFERGMVDYARRANVDGVICGHVHQAALKTIDGKLYGNDGDWVETCSAMVEYHNGEIALLHSTEIDWPEADPVVAPVRKHAA